MQTEENKKNYESEKGIHALKDNLKKVSFESIILLTFLQINFPLLISIKVPPDAKYFLPRHFLPQICGALRKACTILKLQNSKKTPQELNPASEFQHRGLPIPHIAFFTSHPLLRALSLRSPCVSVPEAARPPALGLTYALA